MKIWQIDEGTSLSSSGPPDKTPPSTGGRFVLGRMERLPELPMLPHAAAVAADRGQVAVVDEPVDEGGRDQQFPCASSAAFGTGRTTSLSTF